MTNRQNSRPQRKVPFPVIVLATKGDIEAICFILRHYDGYIRTLSAKRYYDPFGYSHAVVDETIRRRLETKLITKILTFKIAS